MNKQVITGKVLDADSGIPIYQLETKGKMIRCKDCKHWWKENELCTHPKTCDGNVCCLECDSEFYCGYAERKSD